MQWRYCTDLGIYEINMRLFEIMHLCNQVAVDSGFSFVERGGGAAAGRRLHEACVRCGRRRGIPPRPTRLATRL